MAGNAGAGVLGWRVARPRALADRLILAAAFATILLATLIVSAGPMYATAVTSAGLRQTIASAPPEQVGIQVNARGTAVDVDEVTATVDGVAEAGFEGPVTTTHLVRSDSLSIVALTSDEQVVKAGYQEAIADHVDLVDGRLPEGPDEAMLHAAAAEALGLTAGDAVSLAALGREADVRPLQLVGTFVPTEPADDYWWNEALLRDGIAPGSEIDEVALFLLSEDGFRAAFGGENATYAWRFLPEAEGFDAATLGASRRALDGQLRLLGDTSTRSAALNVQTELGALLADTQRALGATRAAVIVTTTQLGLLAVFALVLATGLLVESRQIETALLRSRGATPEQVGAIAAVEGLLLVLPATLLGPLLAVPAVRALGTQGALGGVGLVLRPRASGDAFVLAALAGAACLVALVVPAVRSARSYMETRTQRGRGRLQGLAQRAGIDIILAVIALLGLWQLRRYGTSLGRDVTGAVEVDPFLVVAPAVALAAGSVLALRLIPVAGAILEHRTQARRTLPGALGSWQLARRPQRYARSALLLLLAMAIGTFGTTYAGTWTASQQDQADLALGSDLAVAPSQQGGTELTTWQLDAAYRAIDGVTTVSPRYETGLPSRTGVSGAALVAVDAAVADDVFVGRAATSGAGFSRLEVPSPMPSLDLPEDTTDLRLTATLTSAEVGQIQLAVVLRDAHGRIVRLRYVPLDANVGTRDLAVPISGGADIAGRPLVPPAPFALVGLEVRYRVPIPAGGGAPEASFALSVDRLEALLGSGSVELDPPAWSITTPTIRNGFAQPTLRRLASGDRLVELEMTTGAAGRAVSPTAIARLLPGDAPQERITIPALVTPAMLDGLATSVGEVRTLALGSVNLDVEIVGTIERVPSEAERDLALVVDAGAYAAERYLQGGFVDTPDTWLVAVDPSADVTAVAAQLREEPYDSRLVRDRISEGLARRTDPVPLGLIGALMLGGLAATAFALVGYLASAVVAARERLLEFALLRAVGASTREVRGWLTVESAFTVGLSVVIGAVLGLGLGWLVLPSLALARDGSQVVPTPTIIVPWLTMVFAFTAALLAVIVVPAVLTRALERANIATVLRAGEDR